MRMSGIPSIPPMENQQLREVLTVMKENLELLTGVRSAKLTPLDNSAELADVISALNQVIDRLSRE